MFDKTILVLTILNIDFNVNKSLYSDLYFELSKNANVIVLSLTDNDNKVTKYSESLEVHNIKVSSTFQNSKIKKAINLLRLNTKLLSYIKKNLKDKIINLVLYSTPPITLNKSIKYIKNYYHAKTYLLLKDIFPQNAVDLGMFSKKGLIHKYFRLKEKNVYNLSDNIGCMSEANVKYILNNNNIDKQKIEINPNSIEIKHIPEMSSHQKQEVLDTYGIAKDKFKMIYGGNLGEPQGIEYILKVILENEKYNNFIIIVGSGTQSNRIKQFIVDNNLQNTVFIDKLSKDKFDLLLSACDAGLIFLDSRFTIPNFPSRLLSYLEYSKPVIAATDLNTDVGKTIKNGGFGYWCESNKTDDFFKLINKIQEENSNNQLGKIGRVFLENHYSVNSSAKLIIEKIEV
ncbi:glycosyltransferase family 4 protein [Acholeplasma granularum]|uniref:glycosyltransferase family 4 protein n=1 Tax=Acholeplasma granularum TaxID=264635 RepID=UPI0004B9664F|nr:glycosyltransferase family 4 protein [Acholeplasma granularum]